MDTTAFTTDSSGKLLRTPQGYVAFVPNALPPRELPLSWDLASINSAADRAISELSGLTRTLPNPRLLMTPFARREAVLSSRIEGTQASMADLVLYEAAGQPESDVSDVQEVRNYVTALDHGLARLPELPLSLRLIREMHERLMAGVRGRHLTPGEFRRSQNWIGQAGSTLADASYVPPPVAEMEAALSDLERYLHAPSPLPPLVRLALIHYQFEAIHPFLDGNGRIGRLLVSLLLCVDGLLQEPLLYLSAYLERHRDEYYRLLTEVSRSGAWEEWIAFFLRGVAEQARDAADRAAQLVRLWHDFRAAVVSSAVLLRLIDELFEHPAMTVPQAARRLGVTHRGAQLNIDKLLAAGIVREVTGRRRNRIYMADRIMEILEADFAEPRSVALGTRGGLRGPAGAGAM